MSTDLSTARHAGLARTNKPIRELAARLDRARQARDEKLMRADAEYVEACRRAMSAIDGPAVAPDMNPAAEEATVSA